MVLALLGLSLTACQPSASPVLALAWTGGEAGTARVVIEICPDSVVLRVSIFESAGEKKWVAEAEDSRARVEFDAFDVPPGWTLTGATCSARCTASRMTRRTVPSA